MEIKIRENKEGFFVYSPDFKFGKGFALPYGPLEECDLLHNYPSYDSQDRNEVQQTLDELDLIHPTTAQIAHILSFVPFIPDERVQHCMAAVLRSGIHSFDRCILNPPHFLYLIKKGAYTRKGAFLGNDLAYQCKMNTDIKKIPLNGNFSLRNVHKLSEFNYGRDGILDFLLTKEGIEDLKIFMNYSAPRMLQPVYEPKGASDQNIEVQLGKQIFEQLAIGFPPYYNDFQPTQIESQFVADYSNCYLGNSVEGIVFLDAQQVPEYSNNDPDYIPILDPSHSVRINMDFWQYAESCKKFGYAFGIIR